MGEEGVAGEDGEAGGLSYNAGELDTETDTEADLNSDADESTSETGEKPGKDQKKAVEEGTGSSWFGRFRKPFGGLTEPEPE